LENKVNYGSYDDLNDALTTEEVLMNEQDLLDGLLKAGSGISDEGNIRKIQIKRQGKVLFEFRVRPVSEDETMNCMRSATPASYNPRYKNARPETNWSKFRSLLIYTATVDEDKRRLWDNPNVQEAFRNSFMVFDKAELIDRVLFVGEKSRVVDIIDEISAMNEDDLESMAKN